MSEIRETARGKWPEILESLGISRDFLRNKHGPCPVCGGQDRYRFDDKEGRGTFYCNGCGSGDGFDLLMKYNGWNFRTAAKEVEGVAGTCKPLPRENKPDPRIRLNKIKANAKKLTGDDPVTEYLGNRGINPAPGLFFSDAEPYFEEGKLLKYYPAMLGMVQAPHGKPATWHVTYLEGGKKAPVSSPKKVMKSVGGINGAAIRLYPAKVHLGLAEGVETAIAAYQMTGIPTWAVMNTSGMEGFIVPDAVKEITIFGDNDKNYAGQLAAYRLANRLALKGMKVNVWIPEVAGTDWLDAFTA